MLSCPDHVLHVKGAKYFEISWKIWSNRNVTRQINAKGDFFSSLTTQNFISFIQSLIHIHTTDLNILMAFNFYLPIQGVLRCSKTNIGTTSNC